MGRLTRTLKKKANNNVYIFHVLYGGLVKIPVVTGCTSWHENRALFPKGYLV